MKVLYHANCNDGSGAALAAWMYLGDETSTGESINYIPVQYGQDPPELNGEVFILDFSYKRDVLLEMAKQVPRLTIIDHHKTAQEDLANIESDKIRCVFDVTRSGAVLTWKHFFPTEKIPLLLLHIEDRDLWSWKMHDTKNILTGLQLIQDWRDWRQFLGEGERNLGHLTIEGEAINVYLKLQSLKIIETPPKHWAEWRVDVPTYNLPGFMLSDTLHMALERWPDAPFAVGYFDLPDKRVYSLRSRQGSDVDVSEIAKKHGGGGHKHAAGFVIDI